MWINAAGKHELELGKTFQPFNFSATGDFSGPMVFAGYGISAPEYNYDDYAGLDVKDKIVVVLRHEPQEFDEKSVFAGKVMTRHSQLDNKAVNAKFHGAKAVIFVNDLSNHTDPDELDKFSSLVGPGYREIAFVQVKAEVADEWFRAAGKDVKSWIASVDKDLKPASFAFPADLALEASIDVRRESKHVPNVVAYLPGETGEYVVVGGHFDHLGMGEFSSMAPDMAGKAIHPGADDNASGASGVLELARYFGSRPKQKRGILFLNFSGEEMGLLGSSAYVNHPLLPLDQAVAMINMDMIGRIRDGKIFVGGTATGTTLKALMAEVAPKYPDFKLDLTEQGGYGSSDHQSFTVAHVPVLFFFSGLHADYHKPSDTWDKIDAASAAGLLQMVADTTQHLIDSPTRPQFVRVAAPAASGDRIGQQLRLRSLLRERPRHERGGRRLPALRRARRRAGVQSRSEGGRCHLRVRGVAHQEPLRLQPGVANAQTRRRGVGQVAPRRQRDGRQGDPHDKALTLNQPGAIPRASRR